MVTGLSIAGHACKPYSTRISEHSMLLEMPLHDSVAIVTCGLICWHMVVKDTMSQKRMVTCASGDGHQPSDYHSKRACSAFATVPMKRTVSGCMQAQRPNQLPSARRFPTGPYPPLPPLPHPFFSSPVHLNICSFGPGLPPRALWPPGRPSAEPAGCPWPRRHLLRPHHPPPRRPPPPPGPLHRQ